MNAAQRQLSELRRELLELRELGRTANHADLEAHVERMRAIAIDLRLVDLPATTHFYGEFRRDMERTCTTI